MQLVGGEKPLQLTHTRSGILCCADWSPSGQEIAFGRCDDSGGAVFTVPALGGAERKLTDVVCPQVGKSLRKPKYSVLPVTTAEHPDGQQIVYQLGGGNCQILKNEANGSNPLQLTFFDKGFGGTPAGRPMANGSRSTTITTYTAKST